MSIIDSGHFGTYELLRIILPGEFLAMMILSYLCIFFYYIITPILTIFFTSFIIFGIFLGFFLYDLDFPKKNRFWKKEAMPKMPTKYLLSRCESCGRTDCSNKIKDIEHAKILYFIILHEKYHPNSRNRIFYFGSIYHVFKNIKAIFLWMSYLIMGTSLLFYIIKLYIDSSFINNFNILITLFIVFLTGLSLIILRELLLHCEKKSENYKDAEKRETNLEENKRILKKKRTELEGINNKALFHNWVDKILGDIKKIGFKILIYFGLYYGYFATPFSIFSIFFLCLLNYIPEINSLILINYTDFYLNVFLIIGILLIGLNMYIRKHKSKEDRYYLEILEYQKVWLSKNRDIVEEIICNP